MNKITIIKNTVRIEISGWDKFWSFKGSLTIPTDSISRAYRHDGKLKPPFWRCPGTALPGVIIAGTYYGRGRKEFWNTHFKGAIVFDLKNVDYTRIVVDVENPEKVLSELENNAAYQSAAANRRPSGQLDGSDNLSAIVAADRAFPAAVAELDR